MERERVIAQGSKQKFALGYDSNSLGGMTLADVDFKVKFFAKELRDSNVTGIYEVLKSQCTVGDDGTYYPVCDTTGLDTGRLFAQLEVMYHDDDSNADLVEKIPMVSNVTIVPDVKVYGSYESVRKLTVAGRVYAYSSPWAEATAPTVKFKNSDNRYLAICTSADNHPGEVYQWSNNQWAPVVGHNLAGKYVVAANSTGGVIFYHDGTKWVQKGELYTIES